MSNLLSSLRIVVGSMKAYEQALTVVQNNVTNANTPGYVRQQVDFIALAFQPELELPGGVGVSGLVSSRNAFSERAVWQQSERNGRLVQLSAGLTQVEPVFDISEGSGVAGALDRLYASFSQLTVSPNDIPSRQTVIRRAEDASRALNFSARSLTQSLDHSRRELRSVVDEINRLSDNIRELNFEFRQDFRKQADAGLNARLYSTLEQLSELVDFNALAQPDGTMTILMGGQTPLVMGDKLFEITADLSGQKAQILDFDGKTVTDKVRHGKLKGVLEIYNDYIPAYATELNRLAVAVADGVNNVLAAGVDLNGLPPVNDLFQYDASAGAAMTLSVTAITPEEIAAASPLAPGGNANVLALADLASSREIDGFTLTEFFGQLGAKVGQDITTAQEDARSASLLLSQARFLRDQASAVNLDEEAAALVQYQRAYQATAQMFRVLDEMTEVVLGLLR